MKASYLLFIVPLSMLIWMGCDIYDKITYVNSRKHEKYSVEYYVTKVEITYKDLIKDTVTLDIYEKPTLQLKDGNLSYWKITGETGGGVAGFTPIACYVRTFKVLNSEYKLITK